MCQSFGLMSRLLMPYQQTFLLFLSKPAGDFSLATVKAEACSGKPWVVGQGAESEGAELQGGPPGSIVMQVEEGETPGHCG